MVKDWVPPSQFAVTILVGPPAGAGVSTLLPLVWVLGFLIVL